jgi:hypothetical protein
VKRHEKDGKEGRDRPHDALFHGDSPFCASYPHNEIDRTTCDLGL